MLAQKDMESMPGALAWHTGDKGNTLASIGEDGVIHLWQSAIPSHMLGPSAPLDDALPKLAHSKEMSEGAAPPSYLLERWAVASMTLSKCQLYSSTSRCAALPKPTYSKEIDWRYSPALHAFMLSAVLYKHHTAWVQTVFPAHPIMTRSALLQMWGMKGHTRRA